MKPICTFDLYDLLHPKTLKKEPALCTDQGNGFMYVTFTPADKQKYLVLPVLFSYLLQITVNPLCWKADCCSFCVSQECNRCYQKKDKDEVKNESAKVGSDREGFHPLCHCSLLETTRS